MKHVWISRFILCLLIFLVAGCASERMAESNASKAAIEEYFATDRNFIGDVAHGKIYGSQRAPLTYGCLRLSRPVRHSIGNTQHEKLGSDSLNDFVITRQKLRMTGKEFFDDVFSSETPGKTSDILLYIHGYNTTFEHAAVTMARIVTDLGFRGKAIFFSWPSNGKMLKYVADQNNSDWSSKNLKTFLEELAGRASPKSISIIAHSMGNRETVNALAGLKNENRLPRDRIRTIIMAAPDIDSMIFERDFAPVVSGTGALVTLYVSRNDKAMRLSYDVNGYTRLGGVEDYPVIHQGIDTIDVTNVDLGYLGHDYFVSSRQVLSDIYYIINGGVRAKDRFSLSPVRFTRDGKTCTYWIFEK